MLKKTSINFYIKNREAFGLAFLVAGVPLIYFLRDGVGLAPNNSVFTICTLLLPFLSGFIFKDLKYYEKPNVVAYTLIGYMILLIVVYFLLRDPYNNINGKVEIFTMAVIALFYISMVFISTSKIDANFIKIGLLLSFLGCVILAYSVYKDPFYVLGSRVALRFGDTEDATSNPHITGKAGYLGVIFATLALKYQQKIKWGWLIPTIIFITSMVMLLLSQTILALLSFIAFCGLFFFFNLSFKSLSSFLNTTIRKWYVLLVIFAMFGKLAYEYNKNKDVILPFTNFFTQRLIKVASAVFEDKNKRAKTKTTTDESTLSRVVMFELIVDSWDEDFEEGRLRYLIFGHGYKAHYADIPHLEVYDSFGLFGLLLYSILYFYLFYCCIRYMKNPQTLIGEFVSYAFIYFAILNFSGGVIVDYTRFLFYILVAKFVINKADLSKMKKLVYQEKT